MTDTKNTVSDAILAHYIEHADIVGDNGTPAISTGELAAMARELQSLRASIPGGVGVKGASFQGLIELLRVARDQWNADQDKAAFENLGSAIDRLVALSALDLSPAEPPEDESEYEHPYSDGDQSGTHSGSRHKDNWRKPAAPSNPVVSDEMVQKIAYALCMHKGLRVTVAQLEWLEPALSEAITAALSVNPQIGSDKP